MSLFSSLALFLHCPGAFELYTYKPLFTQRVDFSASWQAYTSFVDHIGQKILEFLSERLVGSIEVSDREAFNTLNSSASDRPALGHWPISGLQPRYLRYIVFLSRPTPDALS